MKNSEFLEVILTYTETDMLFLFFNFKFPMFHVSKKVAFQ